ncbi:hypothetical protein HaLaN_03190 [Haematococcus lacustris]|uniref:Uncharacterized protein n=1 Tax=Haematococcus lacustris TaxID=44745 RepID=A0A699YMX3_HAELA|nr:hypothetical protein HaLaN_03190 [Haematococcus lacustris]
MIVLPWACIPHLQGCLAVGRRWGGQRLLWGSSLVAGAYNDRDRNQLRPQNEGSNSDAKAGPQRAARPTQAAAAALPTAGGSDAAWQDGACARQVTVLTVVLAECVVTMLPASGPYQGCHSQSQVGCYTPARAWLKVGQHQHGSGCRAGLENHEGYDSSCVFVDRLSEIVHSAPCYESSGSQVVAKWPLMVAMGLPNVSSSISSTALLSNQGTKPATQP